MTVGELIWQLQKFNYATPIHFVTSDGEEQKIHEIDEYKRGVYIDFKKKENVKS